MNISMDTIYAGIDQLKNGFNVATCYFWQIRRISYGQNVKIALQLCNGFGIYSRRRTTNDMVQAK